MFPLVRKDPFPYYVFHYARPTGADAYRAQNGLPSSSGPLMCFIGRHTERTFGAQNGRAGHRTDGWGTERDGVFKSIKIKAGSPNRPDNQLVGSWQYFVASLQLESGLE